MKKNKYTLRAQLARMLTKHAATAFVLSLFWLLGASLWSMKIGTYVFAFIGITAYFFSIYNAGFETAADDKKSYSPLTPKPLKGVYLTALLAAVNLCVILIYKIAWHFGSNGEYLSEIWAVVMNVISVIWFSAYKTVAGMNNGHFGITGYLIVFLLPCIASALGYYAGYRDFDIYAKINASVYEKKK